MAAYFKMESIYRKSDVTFHTLRTRLVAAVNARMQNGEFTERGLAKILGVSQPHIHNVLKGARTLQWDLADRLIADLGIKTLDLWTDEELAGEERIQNLPSQPLVSNYRTEGARHDAVPRRRPGYEFKLLRERQTNRSAGI